MRRTLVIVAGLGVLILASVLGFALVRTSDSDESGAEPSEESKAVGAWERVAFDGANYFVVWDADHGLEGERDVYGARISLAGSVLDRPPIRISSARETQADPKVAFDGRNFLVVWSDDRVKPDGENPQHDVFGARVTRAGVVLDPDGIPISTAVGQQFDPSLAFDGSQFLVVWTDFESGFGDIYGTRITTTGKVLDPNGFVISSGDKEQGEPTAAFDGTRYLVAWSEESGEAYDVFGVRLSRAGRTLDRKAIRISRGGHAWEAPAVAFGDENYLVTWTDWGTGYYQEIWGARVSPDGTVLDPKGLQIAQSENDNSGQVVAFDGSSFLVAWSDASRVYGTRVTPDGSVLDTDGSAISAAGGDQGAHGIGFGGETYILTWTDGSFDTERYDVRGALVTTEGAVTAERPITIATAKPP